MNNFFKAVSRSGALASLATSAAAALFGVAEDNNAVAPLNSVSHILWGDRAARRNQPSMKYTATGAALNSVAVTGWAALHELLLGRFARKGPAAAVASGAATAGLADVVDYYVVPRRFTPGFEKRLSRGALAGIYGALALSLAAGSLLSRR